MLRQASIGFCFIMFGMYRTHFPVCETQVNHFKLNQVNKFSFTKCLLVGPLSPKLHQSKTFALKAVDV